MISNKMCRKKILKAIYILKLNSRIILLLLRLLKYFNERLMAY